MSSELEYALDSDYVLEMPLQTCWYVIKDNYGGEVPYGKQLFSRAQIFVDRSLFKIVP